ncbi:MAG: O-antigen ligase family protein [Proteobacteria bacterium]|nr:O-antigen ligase family protein [Pseudomonadota bacterium]
MKQFEPFKLFSLTPFQPIKPIKLLYLFPFFLIPFLGGNHLSLFYVTIDKFWIETTFILFLIIAIAINHLSKKGSSPQGFSRFLVFFMPFAAVNAISLVYTWNRFSTLNELNILVWILGSVYLFSITDKNEALLKALVIGAALSAICAVVQSKVLFPNFIEVFQGGRYAEIAKGQAIPFSSFLYHNVFGGYMCFVLPLAIYFGVYQGKWLYKIATPCIIAGIILSTSRIAMGISFLFVLCFIAVMIKRRDIKSALIMVAIAATSIVMIFTLLHTGKGGEFKGLTAELGKKTQITKSEVTTLNTRTEIWNNGINAFVAKPVIGYGAGAFEYGYRKYFDGGIYTRYAHSTLLKIGVELGLIGILCFLFYIAGFFSCLKGRLKEPEYLFILASTGCGLLFGLLDFSFDMPAHIITFFVLSSAVFVNEESKARVAAGFPACLMALADRSLRIVSYIIIICLLGSFLFTVKANLSGKSIENGIACEDGGFMFNAYNSYVDAIYDMPIDNDGYIKVVGVLKRLYEGEGDPGKKENIKSSLKMYLNNIEEKEDLDSGLFFVAGMSYTTLKETHKAESYLLKAISYYPSSAYYIYEIVRFYISIGDLQKALLWTHAIDPYLDKYRTSKNPKGFYVYKIRDMEAEMEYKQGNVATALSIAKNNLKDAKEGKFIITSVKTGEYISTEPFLNYLKDRVNFFE